MNDRMTAGPASGTASCNTKKMPVPTVAPTPNMVSWKVPMVRFSSGPACPPPESIRLIDFFRHNCPTKLCGGACSVVMKQLPKDAAAADDADQGAAVTRMGEADHVDPGPSRESVVATCRRNTSQAPPVCSTPEPITQCYHHSDDECTSLPVSRRGALGLFSGY